MLEYDENSKYKLQNSKKTYWSLFHRAREQIVFLLHFLEAFPPHMFASNSPVWLKSSQRIPQFLSTNITTIAPLVNLGKMACKYYKIKFI